MKIQTHLGILAAIAVSLLSLTCGSSVYAQTSVPSTFKHITIDGSFNDWTGVPLAYTAPAGPTNAIQYENVYIANDENNLYIRFTLYSPRANAFANSYDNLFIDADNNSATGFLVGGIGSEMLVQWGGGYQEKNGSFNEGIVNNLGWANAGSADNLDFELAVSRGATYASDTNLVFATDTIAILLEGDNTSYASTVFAPPSGGLVYTFASPPEPLSTNLPMLTLTSSSWQVNGSGTDLGTGWLDSSYDDTQAGWSSGQGLFGYTPSPGAYPPIQTALSSGPNTYYFRTHINWNNLPDNVAFVVTNYLSDGAVFYLNGAEINRVRMPAGTVNYPTVATGTNSPVGQYSVFGIPGATFVVGDNILEVETHQAAASSADMVFGLSLTAAAQYPILNLDASQPADRTINGGDPTTFTASLLGSGPLSYQWLFNSNSIPGATNATYTIPQVLYTDAGSYALLVISPLSTNTTRAAVLTVTNTPVTFADPAQPADVVVVEARTVSLTSVVAGSPPIRYQWYFGSSPILGATNSGYTIPAVSLTNAGSYKVNVSNQANSTDSRIAIVTVLPDTLPPALTGISASSTQVVVSFSEPLDSLTAANPAKYSVSGGVSVSGAALNPANASQVILTTSELTLYAIYTLSVNGVKDLFGNAAVTAGAFTRDITIDGNFGDWNGLAPIYSSDTSGTDGAADFKDVYMFNDASNYYFLVTLWHDIPPASGQFPLYANIYYDTDNDVSTGFSPGLYGSELLTQSGSGYQEKNGNFNDGFGINGLGWSCLPASPGTNFEFSISRSATYASDNLPVFTTNLLNVHFQGQTTSFTVANDAPPGGMISYTNVDIAVPTLPVSRLAANPLSGNRVAVTWEGTGTLQAKSSLTSGTWTNVPAATSPYVPPTAQGQLFFRLTQ